MTEIKSFLQTLTSQGFPSIKKLINFVFPKKDDTPIETPSRKWLKLGACLAPFISIGLLLAIFLWARVWVVTYNIESFFAGWFVLMPHIFAIFYGLIAVVILLFFSLLLKLKKRDPSILLALTPIAPFKAFLVICGFHIMYAVFGLHRPDMVGDQGKIYLLQKSYEKEHANQPFPGDKFFGFYIGKSSYEDVLKILKDREAVYQETSYKGLSQFSVIEVTSYPPFEKLYNAADWFEKGVLEFTPQHRLHSITLFKKKKFRSSDLSAISIREIKETQLGMEEFRSYLQATYWPLMRDTGFRESFYKNRSSTEYFYTPAGIFISIDIWDDKTIKIQNALQIDYMKSAQRAAVERASFTKSITKASTYVD